MNKLLLFCLTILSATIIMAQTNVEDDIPVEPDAPEKNEKKKTFESRDRLVMEFNWNWLFNTPDSLGLRGQSRGFNVYGYYDFKLGSDQVGFAPGLGISNTNFYHKSHLNLDTAGNTEIAPIHDFGADSMDVKKNKIALTYIEIPIEFRFRTKPNSKGDQFKFAVGFKGGYLLNGHTKYRGPDPGVFGTNNTDDEVKFKRHDVPNLSKFRYGVTARFGYGVVNVQVFYGLSDIFEKDKGPAGAPFEVGFSFNMF